MNEEIIKELRRIGFTGFVHLDKEKRDGKKRWTWTYPIENEKEWFTVLLLENNGDIVIEQLTNPLGKKFKTNQVKDLMNYIRTVIKK